MDFEQPDYLGEREAHYERFFGPHEGHVMHSTDVKDVHVDIYQFPPNESRPFWTLITGGMSDRRQFIPKEAIGQLGLRAEIMMYAWEPKGWMFSVMKGLAEMPFEEKTFLHWYHTVPNGMPMTAEPSELTSFFFIPPFFEDDDDFDTMVIGGDKVDILQLIPITEAEREYVIEHGSDALLKIFRREGLNPIVEEERRSLV